MQSNPHHNSKAALVIAARLAVLLDLKTPRDPETILVPYKTSTAGAAQP